MTLRLWCIPFTACAVFGVPIDYPRIYWGGLVVLMLILSHLLVEEVPR